MDSANLPFEPSEDWSPYLSAVAARFDREAGIQLGEPDWELPDDLKRLPFWLACQHDHLADRLAIPFYELRQPQKHENCLDLGCGVSFFLYPWTHWNANFYGHELSPRIVKLMQSRAPQLNSKLFKSMKQGPAHLLSPYEGQIFDLVVATGFLYYYPLQYFPLVWHSIQPLLKPDGDLIIDAIKSDSPWVDEWGLIELFKGTEPQLVTSTVWEAQIKQLGGHILDQSEGELFITYRIRLTAPVKSRRSQSRKT